MTAAIVLAALWLGQDAPKTACDFDGFEKFGKLSEVAVAKSGKYAVGDLFLEYHSAREWSCGYLVQKKGAQATWVPVKDLREVAVDAHPPLTAWVGMWVGLEDTVKIGAAKEEGRLAASGSAVWPGGGKVLHTGEFSGEAAPDGNHVRFEEGGGGCRVDLTLTGKYIVANDNNMCGGANVRFEGIWRRGKP